MGPAVSADPGHRMALPGMIIWLCAFAAITSDAWGIVDCHYKWEEVEKEAPGCHSRPLELLILQERIQDN